MSVRRVVGGADRAGGAEDDDQGGEPEADGGLAVVEAPGADAGEACWTGQWSDWVLIWGCLTWPTVPESGRTAVAGRLCFG